MNRRSFILGLLSSTAVPAVVKALPEKLVYDKATRSIIRTGLPAASWRRINQGILFSDYTSMYQGVPIREVTELLTQENEILKSIVGPWPSITDDDYDIDEDKDTMNLPAGTYEIDGKGRMRRIR